MTCPRTYGIRILSRKWSIFLLRALQTPHTFSELKHELRCITNHVLSHELKQLQHDGLVGVTEEKYTRTSAASELLQRLEPLYEWTIQHKQCTPCSAEPMCASCSEFAFESQLKSDGVAE